MPVRQVRGYPVEYSTERPSPRISGIETYIGVGATTPMSIYLTPDDWLVLAGMAVNGVSFWLMFGRRA